MLYLLLTSLSDEISPFNVFRYQTTRTGLSIVTALIFVFLFGPRIISLLKVKQGRGQPIRSDGLLMACACHGVAVVRRPTGGRAVLHDAELTYSAAVPLRGSWGGLTVAQSYRRLGEALCAGLAQLGVAATLGGPSGPGAGGQGGVACFTARHAPAVLVEGRKLIGSAQRRWGDVLLQQGSILLRFDAALHQRLFPDWPREAPSARRIPISRRRCATAIENEL